MPYIESEERRQTLDKIVDLMHELKVVADGDLNYVLYKYGLRHHNGSYNTIKNYRAELRECADEIGRRIMAPHEDEKKLKNGDVF